MYQTSRDISYFGLVYLNLFLNEFHLLFNIFKTIVFLIPQKFCKTELSRSCLDPSDKNLLNSFPVFKVCKT